MNKLPLHALHESCNAQFYAYRNWILPEFYQSIEDELALARNHVALVDMSFRGKLFIKGSDTLDLLQRISTNDLNRLPALGTLPTIFCDARGRLMDVVQLFSFNEGVVAVSSHYSAQPLQKWIEKYIIMEDVKSVDCTMEFVYLLLIGPDTNAILKAFTDQQVGPEDEFLILRFSETVVVLQQTSSFKWPACFLMFWGPNKHQQVQRLLQIVVDRGGNWIGHKAADILRIESGVPESFSEINDRFNPHEARLLRAVSFTKGCYTGQEVIARLDTYDKVQKYTMVVELAHAVSEPLPVDIVFEDEVIGLLTSYAYDPDQDVHRGLGYVKKKYAIADFGLPVTCGLFNVKGVLKLPVAADEE